MMNWVKAFAPGRINVIGEHTDYNKGFVLPAAIEQGTTFYIKRNEHNSACFAKAIDLNESGSFDLNVGVAQQGWMNYVLGTAIELQKKTGKLSGFDCEFSGTVPIGSGMSSSAALGCSLALGLNELFDLQLDRKELARIVQAADHNFVGVKSGIMDQFTSLLGKKNHVILLDCQDLSTQYFPLNLNDYTFLLINTMVSHQLANSQYNERRQKCFDVAQTIHPDKKDVSLRAVTKEQLLQESNRLEASALNFSSYVLEENERVFQAVSALEKNDIQTLGKLLYASHEGLSQQYKVSCEELDFLVEATKDKDYVLGARMMGGGFGGCTINLIQKDKVQTFLDAILPAYRLAHGKEAEWYLANPEDGAKILEKG